ncbi:MAG: DUF3352 domain-containing protein [Bacteroidetes bacterium]|nr:DUF3352 domain-containing protein [Bacteroidota bacterium]
MNRRILSVAGALVLLSAISYYFLNNNPVLDADPLDAIPTDAALIFECKSGSEAMDEIRTAPFWKILQKDSSFSRIESQMRSIDSISNLQPELGVLWSKEKLFVSLHQIKANAFDYLYVVHLPEEIRKGRAINLLEDIPGNQYRLDEREYEDVSIFEFRRGETTSFSFAVSNGLILASKTSFLVEDAIRQLKKGVSVRKSKTFAQVRKNLKTNAVIRCYVNHLGTGDLFSGMLNPAFLGFQKSISNMARWQALSLEVKNEFLALDGCISALDTNDALQIFRKQEPVLSKMPDILPARTAFYLRWGSSSLVESLHRLQMNPNYFDQPLERIGSLAAFNNKYKTNAEDDLYSWMGNEFALAITEPGTTEFENSVFAIVKAEHADQALIKLNALQQKLGVKKAPQTYKNRPIGILQGGDFLSLFYGKTFQRLNNPYFALVNGYVIFANQQSALKNLIDEIDAGKTLTHNLAYRKSIASENQPSYLDLYLNFNSGLNLIKAALGQEILKQLPEHRETLNNLSAFLLKFGKEKEIVSSHIAVSFLKNPKRDVNLLFATQLDTAATQRPALIETSNDQFSVAIQDESNTLYFIDEKGNILWKKQIGEKIMSDIQSVDYYHNGTKELLFNTASRLFLLDQEGNSVAKYPIRLPAEASNGCTLVQNSSLQSLQILVACTNGQVYAYDVSGKPVPSWLFEPFLNGIVDEIKPVRVGKQIHYLVTSTQGKILMADARGRTREIASGLSESQIRSLEILPADSVTNAQFMVIDSNGVILYTLEGNRGSIFNDVSSIRMIKGVDGWPGMNTSVYLILTEDSLLLFSSPETQECLKSLPLNAPCFLESDYDRQSRTWTGLIYPNQNTFFLLADDCSIPGGFPVKGNSKFCVRLTKGDGKNKLLIASTDGNLYVYNLN